MSFNIADLAIALQDDLPGFGAQYVMAPPSRDLVIVPDMSYRIAAVVVLLDQIDGKWLITLMRRTADGGTHSGQISFVGGKYESTDYTYLYTALREMQEEIGVAINDVQVLGKLSPLYIPPSNFMVYPYVVVARESLHYVLSVKEVTELIFLSVDSLLDVSVKGVREVASSGDTSLLMNVPVYNLGGENFIWGATAMILHEFESIVRSIVK
jgi:8-oxo-dGTP pyrophosphatase MutT (NUDIX family)